MAVLKRATKKAVPKKAVPKKEEPKQIVLSQDQYDALASISTEINSLIFNLQDVFVSDSDNVREVAFRVGIFKSNIERQYSKLNEIVTDVDPNPYVYDWEEDDSIEYN